MQGIIPQSVEKENGWHHLQKGRLLGFGTPGYTVLEQFGTYLWMDHLKEEKKYSTSAYKFLAFSALPFWILQEWIPSPSPAMGDRGMIAGTIYFQALWLPIQWSGEMAPSGPLMEPGLRAHLPELEMESSQQGKCMHQNVLCPKGAIQA